jgi:hypothetical protein
MYNKKEYNNNHIETYTTYILETYVINIPNKTKHTTKHKRANTSPPYKHHTKRQKKPLK